RPPPGPTRPNPACSRPRSAATSAARSPSPPAAATASRWSSARRQCCRAAPRSRPPTGSPPPPPAGRDVRGAAAVAARCRYGLPVVVRTAPVLPDGTPFPTLYWLACPAARVAVGRLEAASWEARASERVPHPPPPG